MPLVHFAALVSGVLVATACNDNGAMGTPIDRPPDGGQTSGLLRTDPSQPRYFVDASGKTVFLAGSHTWATLQDNGLTDPPPIFDYTGYLDSLQRYGHNFFRLWLWEQAKWAAEVRDPYYFSPLPFLRTGPGVALDGKPKFDLTRFDEAFFTRLRSRVQQAGERGIYVSVMLFNGWSLDGKLQGAGNPWPGHPFNGHNNINGIDADANGDGTGTELHSLRAAQITQIQDTYVRHVVDAVNDLDNVLYEISNESDGSSVQWQYHMIDLIHQYEATKPKQHPVGMTVAYPGGDNDALFASHADWVSPNGNIDDPAPSADKVVISDTDHLCGVCGDPGFVWRAMLRGLNPIYMDSWFGSPLVAPTDYNDPRWQGIRHNLGRAVQLASVIDLHGMVPRGELVPSGFALVDNSAGNPRLLAYAPDGGTLDVDLRGLGGSLVADWISLENWSIVHGASVAGGQVRRLTAPFSGGALLYVSGKPLSFSTVRVSRSMSSSPTREGSGATSRLVPGSP